MLHDIRYGIRMLAKSPGFSAVAILSLALGIGANSAIFSFVNVILLRPIPVEAPNRLASVFMTDQRNPGNLPLSHLNYKDLRDENDVFSGMAAFTFAQVNWSNGRESEQILAFVSSGEYFSVLGTQPALGRAFLPEEDQAATPVTVLSHAFWERSFAKDPNVIGRTITLNRTPFTIIGVAPPKFTGTLLGPNPSVWVPMSMHDVVQPNFDWYETRRGLFLLAFGRLAPGVSMEQASANLQTIFARLEQEYPTDNTGRTAGAVPLLDARLNPGGQGGAPVVQISMILMGTVGIVLLIACANIANLLLARASGRRREIAVRLALGAERKRLVRQLLTESVMLSIVGGALGALLAYWLLDAIVAANLPLPLPVGAEVTIDGRVLAFTGVLALGTGLLFGLAPAIQASRPDVLPVLKDEVVPVGTGRRGIHAFVSMRQLLVVSQVALSLVSLIAAGLFMRNLNGAQNIDTGFETESVLVMTFNLGREGYTPDRGQLFYEQATTSVAGLPGVTAASVAQNPPLAGGFLRSVFPEGEDTSTRDRILVQVNSVDEGYFKTIGIPVLRGRELARTDTTGTPQVVVINETMAEQFWPGQDALGKRFTFFGDENFTTVVGIARDSKYNAVAEDPIPFIYQPLRQNYTPQATLHVRASGRAAGLAAAVRQRVQAIDPTLSVFNIRTLEEQVAQSLAPLRLNVIMLTTFGLLALSLAAIGLYGVASYAVTQRTREIGVRMALGARPSSVLRLVLGQGLLLVAIGVGVGLLVAFGVSSIIPAALLPTVSVRDPLTFGATAMLLAIVAVVATFIPARRATRIDPLIALRNV